jgi:hypothetical protein
MPKVNVNELIGRNSKKITPVIVTVTNACAFYESMIL